MHKKIDLFHCSLRKETSVQQQERLEAGGEVPVCPSGQRAKVDLWPGLEKGSPGQAQAEGATTGTSCRAWAVTSWSTSLCLLGCICKSNKQKQKTSEILLAAKRLHMVCSAAPAQELQVLSSAEQHTSLSCANCRAEKVGPGSVGVVNGARA